MAYGVGALIVLVLAWLPVETTMQHILYEDCFYYLKLSRNILELGQPTFDGSAPTNGFPPLWMGFCAAVQTVAGPEHALHIVLTAAALLHLAQGYVVFRILAARCRPGIAHLGALFYVLNYRIIACNMCGLETPLYVLLFLLVVHHLIRREGPLDAVSVVLCGMLLALATLARFDQLMVVGYVLVLILVGRRLGGNALRGRIIRTAGVAATVLLMLMPWFVWSVRHSGTLLPRNGEALRLCRFEPFNPNLPISHNLGLLRLKLQETAWWFSDTANLLGVWPIVRPMQTRQVVFVAVLLLLALVLGLAWTRKGKNHFARTALAVYALGHYAVYSLFACAEVRYLIPVCAVLIILIAMVAEDLLDAYRASSVRVTMVGAYALLFAVSLTAGVTAWQRHQGATRTHGLHAELYQMAWWIRENTPPDAVVGSWNAGILGHFSDRTVVNLDGVVNNEMIDVMRRRRLLEYLQDRGIAYIVDMRWEVEKYMRRFAERHDWFNDYEQIHQAGSSVVALRRKHLGAHAAYRPGS